MLKIGSVYKWWLPEINVIRMISAGHNVSYQIKMDATMTILHFQHMIGADYLIRVLIDNEIIDLCLWEGMFQAMEEIC